MESYIEKADHFTDHEKQFQLGFLPSEAVNPLTAHLSDDFARSASDGMASLVAADRALQGVLETALASPEFQALRDAVCDTVKRGGRVCFSGCGATGRLAILLEAMWRDAAPAGLENAVYAIMTGGDFALVKSVEFFEDYCEVGARQVADADFTANDMLVGITATGETASIVGSAIEAAKRGARVFMLICVPKELPPSRLERCRILYGMPGVTVLAMPCGGMAVAGSTRMQSTTLEMTVAAAALEAALEGATAAEYATGFKKLTDSLNDPGFTSGIGAAAEREAAIYRRKGLVTYTATDYLLDVITDTTERSPTFMLPQFRRSDDPVSPVSWAFAKDLRQPTHETWRKVFRRAPRCINWREEEYRAMGVEKLLTKGLPRISAADLDTVRVGNEADTGRENATVVPVSLTGGVLKIGEFSFAPELAPTKLKIFEHLAVKLAMNDLSTGTMVLFGRVHGAFMTYLDISNKKLIDRGVRIVSTLCGIADYRQCCRELFKSLEILENNRRPGEERRSAVQYTIERLREK